MYAFSDNPVGSWTDDCNLRSGSPDGEYDTSRVDTVALSDKHPLGVAMSDSSCLLSSKALPRCGTLCLRVWAELRTEAKYLGKLKLERSALELSCFPDY